MWYPGEVKRKDEKNTTRCKTNGNKTGRKAMVDEKMPAAETDEREFTRLQKTDGPGQGVRIW